MDIYRSDEHAYREFTILFWDEPKQSESQHKKVFFLWVVPPRLANLRNGRQIPMPEIEVKNGGGGMKEFCIEYVGDSIVRVSWRPYVSETDEVHAIIQGEVVGILTT